MTTPDNTPHGAEQSPPPPQQRSRSQEGGAHDGPVRDGTAQARAPRRGPRRPRASAAVPVLFAAWVVLEVWLLMLVGRAAGAWTVTALLLAGVVVGGAVIRRAGLRAWRNFSAALQSGGTAPPESSGAAMMMLGGALLMVPGFGSDALGLLCLFPPTRALVRRLPERFAGRRGRSGGPLRGPLGDACQQARIHRPDGKVVQGEVIDRDEQSRG